MDIKSTIAWRPLLDKILISYVTWEVFYLCAFVCVHIFTHICLLVCVNVFVLSGFMHCIFCILASRTLLKNKMVYLKGFNLLINLHFYYLFFAIIQFNLIFVKETRAMLNSGLNLTLLKHLVQSTMNHTLQLVG